MEVGTPIDEHFNSFYESDMVVGKIDAIFSAAFFGITRQSRLK